MKREGGGVREKATMVDLTTSLLPTRPNKEVIEHPIGHLQSHATETSVSINSHPSVGFYKWD